MIGVWLEEGFVESGLPNGPVSRAWIENIGPTVRMSTYRKKVIPDCGRDLFAIRSTYIGKGGGKEEQSTVVEDNQSGGVVVLC